MRTCRAALLALLAGAALSLAAVPRAEGQRPGGRKAVLVINSYYWGHAWTDGEVTGILSVLRRDPTRPEVFLESMDVLRSHGPRHPESFADYLRERYAERRFDLVMTTDNAALAFVDRYHEELFPGVPVVFSDAHTVDVDRLRERLPITGIRENMDFQPTIEVARRMRPNACKVVVFGNRAETGAGPRFAQDAIQRLVTDIPVELHEDLSLDEIVEVSSKLDPQDIVFPLAFAVNRNGVFNEYVDVEAAVARASPAPVFIFWRTAADGAVGGAISGAEEQGEIGARMALEILKGRDPNSIPVESGTEAQYVFDYRRLRQHGIPLSVLPKGSVVTHRPVYPWEEHKLISAAVLATVAALVTIIGLLLKSIGRRKRAERALAVSRQELERTVEARTRELVDANTSLTQTLDRLEQTQKHLIESEKMAALGGLVSGVAHEINTPLGVALTAVSSLADRTADLRSSYEQDGMTEGAFEEYLQQASRTADMVLLNLEKGVELIRSFKQVAVDQTSEAVRRIDLRQYLEVTVESLAPELKAGAHEVRIECPEDIEIETYPGAISQVLSNLVINSVRHGFGPDRSGGRIEIAAREQGELVELAYRDDGVGMAPEVLSLAFEPFFTTARGQGGSGLGLHVVYNLVTHKLRGHVTCESRPGEGIRMSISFPRQATRSPETLAAPHLERAVRPS